MFSTQVIFHKTNFDKTLPEPNQFTYPFSYEPHPWVKQAAQEVQEYLKYQTDFDYQFGWDDNSIGKMFGILIVKNRCGELGYLASFSGKIGDANIIKGFVPPIFDVLNPDGFYKKGEAELDKLTDEIKLLEDSDELKQLQIDLLNIKNKYQSESLILKDELRESKKIRNQKRENAFMMDSIEKELVLHSLENESKKDHFRLKDFKKYYKKEIQNYQDSLDNYQSRIRDLKNKRRKLSSSLQKELHKQFVFKNNFGLDKDLFQIFDSYNIIPPAGAGECAAPRLLQYAYNMNFHPLAMGEFWWGKSPTGIIRKQGNYYPACKSKCKPILSFMLEGLDVEKNRILKENSNFELDIVYQDDYLIVVNKPAGVLSVPGKEIDNSLQTKVRNEFNDDNLLLVHRLDMATSGLVLVAKNMEIYKQLQKQFVERTVKKTYTAVLDGEMKIYQGKIELPLRVDLDNRPMQMVCYEHGKESVTYFKVVKVENGKTRILLFPYTGRTHQLRVHCAHTKGLGMPIVGDLLYGKEDKRLHLCANELIIKHPNTNKLIKFCCPVPF